MGASVTKDEADKKAESVRKERERIIRDNPTNADRQAAEINALQLDRTVIKNPNKRYAYHLANRSTQDGARIQVLEGLGSEIVPDDAPERLLYGRAKDGGQVHGDLILVRTPIEIYEQRRQRKRELYEMRMGEQREATREVIEKELRDSGHARPHKEATTDQSGDY